MVAGAAWVGGTVRTTEKAATLSGEGIAARIFDGVAPTPEVSAALSGATHLLVSIPPGEEGDPVVVHHGRDLAASSNLGWVGYLSTVGVYGNYGGAWVSERSTPHPRAGRSARRLEAEAAWRALAAQCRVPLAIFRIAGIYGPGRNALKNIADGKARRIVKPGQVFNRIHVDDIALAVAAAIEHNAHGIFNLADDEPSPPEDVVEFAARLMGVPVPPAIPFETAELTPMARSFYGDSKRVSNRRTREELAVALSYPTYRDGLATMWRDGSWRRR
jgi:nucleoside-diphosphate-sugar epimerase